MGLRGLGFAFLFWVSLPGLSAFSQTTPYLRSYLRALSQTVELRPDRDAALISRLIDNLTYSNLTLRALHRDLEANPKLQPLLLQIQAAQEVHDVQVRLRSEIALSTDAPLPPSLAPWLNLPLPSLSSGISVLARELPQLVYDLSLTIDEISSLRKALGSEAIKKMISDDHLKTHLRVLDRELLEPPTIAKLSLGPPPALLASIQNAEADQVAYEYLTSDPSYSKTATTAVKRIEAWFKDPVNGFEKIVALVQGYPQLFDGSLPTSWLLQGSFLCSLGEASPWLVSGQLQSLYHAAAEHLPGFSLGIWVIWQEKLAGFLHGEGECARVYGLNVQGLVEYAYPLDHPITIKKNQSGVEYELSDPLDRLEEDRMFPISFRPGTRDPLSVVFQQIAIDRLSKISLTKNLRLGPRVFLQLYAHYRDLVRHYAFDYFRSEFIPISLQKLKPEAELEPVNERLREKLHRDQSLIREIKAFIAEDPALSQAFDEAKATARVGAVCDVLLQ